MEAFKSWTSSKAVMGGGLAIVAGLLAIGAYFGKVDFDRLMIAVSGAGSFIGGVLAIYGRFAATTQLVGSAAVAEAANNAMTPGVPAEAALVVAKAKIAAAENNRDIA